MPRPEEKNTQMNTDREVQLICVNLCNLWQNVILWHEFLGLLKN
jgi:hypothetical protein